MKKRSARFDDDFEDDLDDDLDVEFDEDFNDDLDDEFDDDLDDERRFSSRRGRSKHEDDDGRPKVRRLKSWTDRLIADCAQDLRGPNVLVILAHGTTLASALREVRPDLSFTFFTPEHFFFRTLQQYHGEESHGGSKTPETNPPKLICAADLPEGEFDDVMFATSSGDSSDVAQEMFQTVHQRLRAGGKFFVSTNNPKDRWVQSQLKTLFSKVDVRKFKHGVVCVADRTAPLKKIRGFRARFDYRLGERIVTCETRPGVFSHRRLDGGARALIKSLSLIAEAGESPRQIIEMGCGCGSVSVAAAISFPEAKVLSIDSDARALDCTQQSARLNSVATIETLLLSDGVVPAPGTWDLVLGNPPYYSDFRIAELFLQAARRGLKPGGRIHIVTKPTEWQAARMNQLFVGLETHKYGDYVVFVARQRQ
ncbi:MAG: methyltransferase [Planctomycetaceae bacterium]|nr:methyltransferase [Planctomycetaceae bacterium]